MKYISALVLSVLFQNLALGSDGFMAVDSMNRDTIQQRRLKKFDDVIHKVILVLSYMNYSDRIIDRPLKGQSRYLPYQGRVIRNIRIQILPPYGVSLDEPEKYQPNKLQKLANKMQLKTLEWVVKNDLQFKEGDTIEAIDFSDTEKLFWERANLKDFKIEVTPVDSGNYADVLILARDRWSWNLKSAPAFDNVTFGVVLSNFLGFPHSITQTVSLNFRADNFYLVEGVYRYNNIVRTKINFLSYYNYSRIATEGGAGFEKKFQSADDRWAGCILFDVVDSKARQTSKFGPIISTNTLTLNTDIWFARSFVLKKSKTEINDEYFRIITSARVFRTDYLKRPYLFAPDNLQQFLNGMFVLGGIGFSSWDYYFDRMVYNLGNGEYFSKGNSLSFIMGMQYDEKLKHRVYLGFKFNHGVYLNKAGYLFAEMNYSAYMKPKERGQGLIKLKGTFYSKPLTLKKWYARHFFSAAAYVGINQVSGRENIVNHLNGLTGVYFDALRGNITSVLNYEVAFYPTFKVFGLTSNIFAFTDLAITAGSATVNAAPTRVYPSAGFGLRVRNLEFAWGYIELSFSYTPVLKQYNFNPALFSYDEENRRAITRSSLFDKEMLSLDF